MAIRKMRQSLHQKELAEEGNQHKHTNQTTQQVGTLCAVCVSLFGTITPHTEIMIINGTSFCLDHAGGFLYEWSEQENNKKIMTTIEASS